VLVQVKGGAYVDSGVRLDVDRWEYLLASASPVYLAAVPAGKAPWIASVERLLPLGLEYAHTAIYEARPSRDTWHCAYIRH
jgi:hypothetical protein